MLSSLIRKVRQVQADPVLRTWLLGRAIGRWSGESAFVPHHPPYLDGMLPLAMEVPTCEFSELSETKPIGPVAIELAGGTIHLEPGQEAGLFHRSFADVETLLSLHRFAFLDGSFDPAWAGVLWQAWLKDFAVPNGDWPWHPYTASERANNVLAFARRHGLPGPFDETLSVLAAHAQVIADRLEYFGDHHTSNHLANNGRGLLVLGTELGLPRAGDLGARILLHEAERIFTPSGLLREGSSHYHMLYLRLYETAAAMAENVARSEAGDLRYIADTARQAANVLMLPGGMALIGDISPDITPAALLEIVDVKSLTEVPVMPADGWLRYDHGLWSGLWHAAPGGFSHMPGHGHNDCGSFELHYEDEPVFVDPGRGAYGEKGEAALYRSARMHNGVTVDGAEPFPPNRPYYDEKFRRKIGGKPPELSSSASGVTLKHQGFMRLSRLGNHERSWRFDGPSMALTDSLEGRGSVTITRTLITPLDVERVSDDIRLKGKRATYVLIAGGADITIEPVTRWFAYGRGKPAHAIRFNALASLPFSGAITLEAR